ncbi:MAG: hypothetical protein QW803_12920 [Candidatus Methanomethylicia archaeon]
MSELLTDRFKPYLDLSELGCVHEYVNHFKKWVIGKCHIIAMRMKYQYLDCANYPSWNM